MTNSESKESISTSFSRLGNGSGAKSYKPIGQTEESMSIDLETYRKSGRVIGKSLDLIAISEELRITSQELRATNQELKATNQKLIARIHELID